MSISHLLEDFGVYARGTPVSLTDVTLEEQKLEAFEKGYQAGWDDSAKAVADDGLSISADFTQTLRDLSFTYEEAYGAVLQSLRPLLDQIISTVLPALVHKTLGTQISELLEELAREHGAQPVEIATSPADVASLDNLVRDTGSLSITVVEETSLAAGQAYIRFGTQEREINLAEVLRAIDQAVIDFFEENQKESA